ncbi:MAG TPA: HD domain-containing protein [Thermoplasmata archaeon]|nr:HD domain-containing protein [Thermoplasmata archaeon]
MGRAARRGAPRKSIFDPVHGPISLDGPAVALIGTPEFQRLWGIRQTGFAHLVFPGANHTRLEHSLGTYWVAREIARRLELGPDEVDRVAAAGLLHDLGHPPFSHTLDGPLREVTGYDHERLSRLRIEGRDPVGGPAAGAVAEALERFGLVPRAVADLIDPRAASAGPRRLSEILHGPIDADRIDYMQRDAHYTGVAHGAADAARLLDTLRSAGGRLAFAEKGLAAVEGFLIGRVLMYSAVYYHKTVRAAEMMAQAAVERLPGYPTDARALFGLTDGEMLVRLEAAGGASERLARALAGRRLHKRVRGWRTLDPKSRAAWRKLLHDPPARRALEDRLAERLGAPSGAVLLDLAGVEPRAAPGDDPGEIRIVTDGNVERPFRRAGAWRTLARSPPAEWAVAISVEPRYRSSATTRFARLGPGPE